MHAKPHGFDSLRPTTHVLNVLPGGRAGSINMFDMHIDGRPCGNETPRILYTVYMCSPVYQVSESVHLFMQLAHVSAKKLG